MQHDASTLIREAQTVAHEQLARDELLPGVYLLARRNPQTGAPFTHPTAVASWADAPFDSAEAFESFITQVREEVARLDASAVVISSEAVAEVERAGGSTPKRVLVLRIETEAGVEWMHAAIGQGPDGRRELGTFFETPDVFDPFGGPLLGGSS